MSYVLIRDDGDAYCLLDVYLVNGTVCEYEWGYPRTLEDALRSLREQGRMTDLTPESRQKIRNWIEEGRE